MSISVSDGNLYINNQIIAAKSYNLTGRATTSESHKVSLNVAWRFIKAVENLGSYTATCQLTNTWEIGTNWYYGNGMRVNTYCYVNEMYGSSYQGEYGALQRFNSAPVDYVLVNGHPEGLFDEGYYEYNAKGSNQVTFDVNIPFTSNGRPYLWKFGIYLTGNPFLSVNGELWNSLLMPDSTGNWFDWYYVPTTYNEAYIQPPLFVYDSSGNRRKAYPYYFDDNGNRHKVLSTFYFDTDGKRHYGERVK